MGAVYAGATMTIIACAGDDPTFGLPGISSNIDRTIKWSSSQAASYISLSTWLQRGWTFQENYLSKRRLLFTEIGPIYMCKSLTNSDVACDSRFAFETTVRFIIDEQRPRGVPNGLKVALSQAERIMDCYSLRRLGYELDSLNAVVGVLNTLSTGQFPIRHIWGVPFSTEETVNGSIIRIALNWSTRSPGARRPAFPSWSSLGWSSYKSRDWAAYSTYSCSEDFNLDIWQNNKFQNISEMEEGYQDAHCMDPASQRLQITAYSVQSDASLWIELHHSDLYSHQIILPGTDNLALCIRLHWDVEQHALKPDSSVLCVFQSALSKCGLILKCYGKYYERVGCFVMHERLEPFLFRQRLFSTGAAFASKSGLIQRRTIELR